MHAERGEDSLEVVLHRRPADPQLLADHPVVEALGGQGEVIVPITEGKLDFGPWQRVFYG